MDGGRRLLRSLKEAFGPPAFARPALAGLPTGNRDASETAGARPRHTPAFRQRRRGLLVRLGEFGARPGVGLALAIGLVGGSALFGAVRGGQYDDFVTAYGSPLDFVASSVGLGLDAVTIVGAHELTTEEVLQGAGITGSQSLLFLDAAALRDRLKLNPLVQDASIRKFYPGRLLVEIVERVPYALWQRDGSLSVISADGKEIQDGNDGRFASLPFVVGEGANKRVDEFLKLIAVADDLRPKIRAGLLIGQRRWTLKLTNGMDVKMPEKGAEQSVAVLARMVREGRLLDKDILFIDMRIPGRVTVRLTEEAAAARAESTSRKKGKGGQT